MYGKLFTSMYDGTLVEDWRALITFQQLIILCDSDGVIDMTPNAISSRTGIPIDYIKAGIEILEKEDKYSRTNKDDGKRIILIDEHRPWGWRIVNHKYYRDLASKTDKREKDKERIANKRKEKRSQVVDSKEVSQSVASSRTKSQMSPIQDTYTDTIKTNVKLVFDHWKTTLKHPRAQLDSKRSKLIANSLKIGYSVDDLKKAIVGCSQTPHNMGQNENNQKYDSIELIFRNSGQIDRFMNNADNPPAKQSAPSKDFNDEVYV